MANITERSIYTQEIINLLKTINEGETVTYEQMAAKIGMGVKPSQAGYGYQHSAREILEKEEKIVFEVLPKIGLKRLTAEEIAIGSGQVYLKSKKSLIKRSKRRIGTIDDKYDDLSDTAKLNTNTLRTILAFDAECSKQKNVLKIQDAAKNTNKLIGFDNTIDLFKK